MKMENVFSDEEISRAGRRAIQEAYDQCAADKDDSPGDWEEIVREILDELGIMPNDK